MTTITIPKRITKGEELVVMPRKAYEEVLHILKKRGHSKLDKDLDKIIKEVRRGRVIGPFSSVKALRASLFETPFITR